MKPENLSNKLQVVNSIFREWEGFSAEVVSYCGSRGIGGHLYILLSDSEQSFALSFDAPELLNTKLQWQIDQLEISIDDTSRKIIVQDTSNSFIVHSHELQIDKFLHHNVVVEGREQVIAARKSAMISRPLHDFHSFSQLSKGIANSSNLLVQVSSYDSLLNSLALRVCFRDAMKSEFHYSDTFIVFSNSSYLYYRDLNIDFQKICIEERDSCYHLTNEDGAIALDYRNIQICDVGDFAMYSQMAHEKVDWFLPSMSFLMKIIPNLLVRISLY